MRGQVKRNAFLALGILGGTMVVGAVLWGLFLVNAQVTKVALLFIAGFITFAVGMTNAD